MTRVLLDSHALLWFLEDNPRLSKPAATVIADPSASLYLPSIALAEILLVIEKGGRRIDKRALLDAIAADPRILVLPLIRSDVVVAMELLQLRSLHDRFIVASARRLQAAGEFSGVVTADAEIAQCNLVPIIW